MVHNKDAAFQLPTWEGACTRGVGEEEVDGVGGGMCRHVREAARATRSVVQVLGLYHAEGSELHATSGGAKEEGHAERLHGGTQTLPRRRAQ